MSKAELRFFPVGHIRVVDGDTLALEAMASEATGPLGVGLFFRPMRVRLARINAPELKTGSPGVAAREALQAFVARHTREGDTFHLGLRIVTTGTAQDHYGGRMVAEVVSADGKQNASDVLLSEGLAQKVKP